MQPRAWMEIQCDALRENYYNLCKFTNMQCICVVKADGYGHDAIQEAKVLQACGATFFAVACAQEAVELRNHGICQDILILGHTMPEQIAWLWQYDLVQTIGDLAYGEYVAKTAKKHHKKVRVHFKIDTGMHRLGILRNESWSRLLALYYDEGFVVEGAFSHFAVADSTETQDVAFTHLQYERFVTWLNEAKRQGMTFSLTHLAASAGIVNYPEFLFDACRPGILLLGFDSGEMAHPYKRKPVMELKSLVGKVDWLDSLETIGYGRTFEATQRMRVATIPIGYGDGVPRNYEQGAVLIQGTRCAILGRISMDQMSVDVSHLKCIDLFEEVTIIGTQGDEAIFLEEMATKSHTIANEIATKISKRIPRLYR